VQERGQRRLRMPSSTCLPVAKPVGPKTNIDHSRSATTPSPASNTLSRTTSAVEIVGHRVLLLVVLTFFLLLAW
jgi:hypothetical protein